MFSKNASNQSGIAVDNIQANNQLQLPSGSVITNNSDSVLTSTNQSIAGTKTFTGTILANSGYTLPTTVYTLNLNSIGYTILGTLHNVGVNIAITNNTTFNIGSINLTRGTWIVLAQVDYVSAGSVNFQYTRLSTYLQK